VGNSFFDQLVLRRFCPPVCNSLDEIYERLRDKEFATHVCTEYLRTNQAKG